MGSDSSLLEVSLRADVSLGFPGLLWNEVCLS